MDFYVLSVFAFLLLGRVLATTRNTSNVNADVSFDQFYQVTWGYDHVLSLNQGREIQLSMDKSSGAGFGSKQSYGSGFFHMRIKLPDKDSAGVVTAYYLTSNGGEHDELDFEFLGNREGKPITLQTNVFVHGYGNREQRIRLWFDPTADFHNYQILWNQRQIVFYVDDIPIRVFKNNTNVGVAYTSHAMQVQASLWDGDDWATDGGQTKTNWSHAPFVAHFQGFDINGCQTQGPGIDQNCYTSGYWWNTQKYWELDAGQQNKYENVRKSYMTYDYCTDKGRYPVPPAECLYNM
ncbi:hypothetical protein SLA2020_001040 [Shorea laevis]